MSISVSISSLKKTSKNNLKAMESGIQHITIRRVTGDDLEEMTEYRIAYLTELQGERSPEYIAVLKKELLAYFRDAMAAGKFFALVAESENCVLAYGGMVIKEIPGDFNKASYLEGDILNMYTIPEERRKGISTMILNQLITEARKSGISKVSLHTSPAGEKLYRKSGFSDPLFPVLELVID
jgi:GNAT superfamily N-acetyltransferase